MPHYMHTYLPVACRESPSAHNAPILTIIVNIVIIIMVILLTSDMTLQFILDQTTNHLLCLIRLLDERQKRELLQAMGGKWTTRY